jgi:hypothetical protein
MMDAAVVDACLDMLAGTDIRAVDLHGGRAELHPRFRELVILARALHRRVVHRCNLAILGRPTPSGAEGAELLAEHAVDVVAALPWGMSSGGADGLADRALEGLRRLNAAGYARPGSGLFLVLVVPAAAAAFGAGGGHGPMVERRLRHLLQAAHDVRFDQLVLSGARVAAGADGDPLALMQAMAGELDPRRLLALPRVTALSVAWDGGLTRRVFGDSTATAACPRARRSAHAPDAPPWRRRTTAARVAHRPRSELAARCAPRRESPR